MTTDTRWVVALLRVSSADQKKGHSLAGQKMTIQKFAESKGDVINKFYDEKAVSAFKNVTRPIFDELLDDVKANKIKKIYVWKGDRLTRKFMLNEELHKIFIKHDVTLISLTEDIDFTTADGRATERKRAVDRQAESERTGERTNMGLMTSAYSGNYPKAWPKLGYKWKNNFTPSPIEIDYEIYDDVIAISRKILDEKIGIPTLKKWLNANNILNRKWTENFLYSWLEDPIWCGTYVNKLKKPSLVIENHSPALITKQEFELMQSIIHQRYRKRKFNYLCKGTVYCNCCGSILKVQPAHNHQGIAYLYYYCKKCNKRINETKIFDQIKMEVQNMVLTSDEKDTIAQNVLKQGRIVKSLNDYNQLYIDNEISEEQYQIHANMLKHSLEEIKKTIDLVKNRTPLDFERLSLSQRKEFMKKNIVRINVDFNEKRVYVEKIE